MNKRILIIIIGSLFIILILLYTYSRYKDNKEYETICYDCNNKIVKTIYDKYNNLYDEKVTIYELLTYQDEFSFELEHDSYGNDCLGYYIIKDDEIDSSHICDMLD